MEKKINAGIFIVPNRLANLSEEFLIFNECYEEKIKNMFPGWTPGENEKLVEIWVFDLDKKDENYSDNWSCHGKEVPGFDESLRREFKKARENKDDLLIRSLFKTKEILGRWPSYLPLSLLVTLKEGEKISCNFKGTKVELTAVQKKSRYRSYGHFEDILNRLIDLDKKESQE